MTENRNKTAVNPFIDGGRKKPRTVNLASGVSKENFAGLAKDFINARGDGFVISTRPWTTDSEAKPAGITIPQWGAWRAYRVTLGLSVKFMDLQCKNGKTWTVPAEWPHLFDAARTVAEDEFAGQAFGRNHRVENIKFAEHAERAAHVAAYRRRMSAA